METSFNGHCFLQPLDLPGLQVRFNAGLDSAIHTVLVDSTLPKPICRSSIGHSSSLPEPFPILIPIIFRQRMWTIQAKLPGPSPTVFHVETPLCDPCRGKKRSWISSQQKPEERENHLAAWIYKTLDYGKCHRATGHYSGPVSTKAEKKSFQEQSQHGRTS